MANLDNSDLKRLVEAFRSESTLYYRQFVVWLGLGSAGAAVAFVSLAARLPEPSYAIRIFLPSLWAFSIGVLTAGLSVLFASFSSLWAGAHFAEANNRQEFSKGASKIPEIFSSPPRLAIEGNQERNHMIDQANRSHQIAEHAWQRHQFWQRARNTVVAISAVAFLSGMIWAIGYVTFGGSLIRQ